MWCESEQNALTTVHTRDIMDIPHVSACDDLFVVVPGTLISRNIIILHAVLRRYAAIQEGLKCPVSWYAATYTQYDVNGRIYVISSDIAHLCYHTTGGVACYVEHGMTCVVCSHNRLRMVLCECTHTFCTRCSVPLNALGMCTHSRVCKCTGTRALRSTYLLVYIGGCCSVLANVDLRSGVFKPRDHDIQDMSQIGSFPGVL